eukprot:6202953-Pleurochrysis_carterae.AAC.1
MPASDPKSRKQALIEDREGWAAAERADIASHRANGSWTMIDRSEVPSGRSCGSSGFTNACAMGQSKHASASRAALKFNV